MIWSFGGQIFLATKAQKHPKGTNAIYLTIYFKTPNYTSPANDQPKHPQNFAAVFWPSWLS